jgi:hypothetical protein
MTVPYSAQRPQLNTAQTFPQQDAAQRGLNKPARTTTMQIEALKRDRSPFRCILDLSIVPPSVAQTLIQPPKKVSSQQAKGEAPNDSRSGPHRGGMDTLDAPVETIRAGG